MAIWSPSDQDSIFDHLWRHNRLRTRPRALGPWPGPERIGLTDRLPILLFNCGLIQLGWTAWTQSRSALSPPAVAARGKSFGRRCLVPAAAVEMEGYTGTVRIAPVDEPFLLIGAIWRPSNQYGHQPDTISLLFTGAPVDWETHMEDAPVIVPVHRCADWLDAGRDTIPLQEPPNVLGIHLAQAERSAA
jgi:hypothetical protein